MERREVLVVGGGPAGAATAIGLARRGRDVVLLERAPAWLEPSFRPSWSDAGDDAARLRVIIDQVASLTDAQAVGWHAAHH